MATHGDHDPLVDYDDRSSCSAVNSNQATSFESQLALQRASTNDVSRNDTTSCHNGEISAPNRIVANLPIPHYVDD